MIKIKEKISDLFSSQKNNFKQYACTLLIIAITTVFAVFSNLDEDHVFFYGTMALSTILIFTIETCSNIKWYRIPMYISAIIIARISIKILEETSKNESSLIYMFLAGVYICIGISAIYKLIKKSEITVNQYLSRVFNNSILIGIVYGVLQLGFLFILAIANVLLFGDKMDTIWYAKMEIILLGFYFLPALILSMINVKNEILKQVHILLNYIMLPLVTLAELIIYLYFIKILITGEIPSNQIFLIISVLFLFEIPISVMIFSFREKNSFIKNNAKILPYSFIPLIIMQFYAMGIRVLNMGLTPERYLGIALVLFEVFVVFFMIFNKQKYLIEIFKVLIVFIVIVLCLPKVNMIEVSCISQARRLKNSYNENQNFEDLSAEDKKNVYSAYMYLTSEDRGERYIPNYIDKQAIEEYYKQYDDELNCLDYNVEYYNFNSSNKEEFSVEVYNRVKVLDLSESPDSENENVWDEAKEEYQNTYMNIDEIIEKIKEISVLIMNGNELTNDNRIIKINDSMDLYISDFSMSYNSTINEVRSFNIEGYLLIK